LDLILLQRRSIELGARLAFVTRDAEVRYLAGPLGIPVFDTLRQAQSARWRRPRRRKIARQGSVDVGRNQELRNLSPRRPISLPSRLSLIIRLGAFILGLLGVLALAAALLPGAQITLTPSTQIQELNLPVSVDLSTLASESATANTNLSGELPAHPVQLIVEGQSTITTTGSILVPESFAEGTVRFTNMTTQSITIPVGTVVAAWVMTDTNHDTVRFATTRTSRLKAGPNTTSYVPVRALAPGSAGNLPYGSIRVVEGALDYRVSVTNQQPIRGGTDRLVPAPAPNDRIRVYNQLIPILRERALEDIDAGLHPGDVLLRSTLTLEDTLEKIYDPPSEQPAGQLRLKLRMEFQAWIVAEADLRRLATILLDANLPEGYVSIPQTLTVESKTPPKLDTDSTIRWQLYARRSLQASLAKDQATNLVLGQTITQAVQRLADELPLAIPPRITIIPDWWPRLPVIPLRITVTTMPPGQ
jgi:hypothetical protein